MRERERGRERGRVREGENDDLAGPAELRLRELVQHWPSADVLEPFVNQYHARPFVGLFQKLISIRSVNF